MNSRDLINKIKIDLSRIKDETTSKYLDKIRRSIREKSDGAFEARYTKDKDKFIVGEVPDGEADIERIMKIESKTGAYKDTYSEISEELGEE
jgi:hypothetical protein